MTERLLTIASLIPNGIPLIDVGCDHAYLPVYLVNAGSIPCAVAADINKGPLMVASRNINKHGLADKIETRLANGLCGIHFDTPVTITVCGMGGESIVSILESADIQRMGVTLVLNPLTHESDLRRFLARTGFCTTHESALLDGGKSYIIIKAEYDGQVRSIDEFEAFFGSPDFSSDAVKVYINKKLKNLRGRLLGTKTIREFSDINSVIEKITDIMGDQNDNSTKHY